VVNLTPIYIPLKSRGKYLALIAGLVVLLIATNLYWYTRINQTWPSQQASSTKLECIKLKEMLANISRRYERLLVNKTIIESEYRKLLRAYNSLLNKINESESLLKNLALLDAYKSLNKTITVLLNETIARTTIGKHTKIFMVPSQLLDTVIGITGSLYREDHQLEDIAKIYNWVSNNITTTPDQPFIQLHLVYLKAGNKTFAANLSYEYVDRFIQTDIETLDRRAGDLLDKTILLTSLLQEYLQGVNGKAYLLYTRVQGAELFSTFLKLEVKKKNQYLVLDIATKIYGPYEDPRKAFTAWLREYRLTLEDLDKIWLINNEQAFYGNLEDALELLQGGK